METKNNKKIIGISATILLVVIISVIVTTILMRNDSQQSTNNNTNNSSVSEPSNSEEISDKIVGDPATAKLVLYEYADFACSHCASWNMRINQYIKNNPGKIAVVFHAFDLGFPNGHEAAKAATAAQIQGYFKEFKDLLFANQAEWIYADSRSEFEALMVSYFKQASKDKGDYTKFKDDMLHNSKIEERLTYEMQKGTEAGIKGTPSFFIDGKQIELSELQSVIEEKLQ